MLRVLEESKTDVTRNPDRMTYEQLLKMEEDNGKISKGLTEAEIQLIPEIKWKRKKDTTNKEESCSICFDDFERGEKVKELQTCNHAYHSKCLNEWLSREKRCPVCNKIVI